MNWTGNEPLELTGLRIRYLYVSKELVRYCDLPGDEGDAMITYLTAKMSDIFLKMARYVL